MSPQPGLELPMPIVGVAKKQEGQQGSSCGPQYPVRDDEEVRAMDEDSIPEAKGRRKFHTRVMRDRALGWIGRDFFLDKVKRPASFFAERRFALLVPLGRRELNRHGGSLPGLPRCLCRSRSS